MQIKEQKVVGQVQELSTSLSTAGKLEVLNHLIGQLSGKNLEGLSAESRERLLRVFSEVREPEIATTRQAALGIAPHKLCRLEVSETRLGRDVSFVIPQGMSGRQILEAIEKANPRAPGDGVVWPKSALLRDDELDTVAFSDVQVKVTVFFTFNNLTRSEQHARLAEKHREFTPRWAVTLAAALYRDANGFPSDRSGIGKSRDAGDLFKGFWVREASGALSTDQAGISVRDWSGAPRYAFVVAAGSPLSNKEVDRREVQ